MKTKLIIPMFVLNAALQFGCAQQQATGLHTPPEGSAERKAILDGLRAHLKATGGATHVFVVRKLNVHSGWAWVSVDPQSADGSKKFETVNGLLHLESGAWKVKALQPVFGEVEDTDPDYKKWFRHLKEKYPTAPADIFPQ